MTLEKARPWLVSAVLFLAAAAMAPSWALKAGTWHGKILVPDPTNLAVGFRNTDEPCTVKVSEGSATHMKVEVSFIDVPVMVQKAGKRGGPFHLGDFKENEALMLQTHEGAVVAVTHTSYDENGDLNYGVSGTGDMFRECMIDY